MNIKDEARVRGMREHMHILRCEMELLGKENFCANYTCEACPMYLSEKIEIPLYGHCACLQVLCQHIQFNRENIKEANEEESPIKLDIVER